MREAAIGKRWFYIQPIFIYPTTEVHQIGVENLENCDILPFIEMSLQVLNGITNFTKSPDSYCKKIFLQLSNVKIPQICAEIFGIPLSAFEKIDVGAIESANPLMAKLLRIYNKESLEAVLQNTKDLPNN